jgi:hypothetical protein
MTIEQQVLEKLHDLPPEKQKEVLDFVDFLKEKNEGPKKPLRSLLGLWSDPQHSTSRKKTSPKLAAKCGATSRVTSTYERGVGYTHCALVFGKLHGIVSDCPNNEGKCYPCSSACAGVSLWLRRFT